MIDVPAVVGNKARAVGAERWLEELPELVRALEAEWSIRVGAPYPEATEAFVAPATRGDGSPAVLKLLVPRAGAAVDHEVTVLRLAGGRGCVALLRDDPARGAMLLERLGPSMFDLRLPFAARLPLLADLASRVWQPAAGAGLPTGAAKGRWLVGAVEQLWEELDRPCSERVVAHAIACAERRIAAHDDERAVLVHGDVHQWNALRAGADWKLVDPDGLLAEREYDLGILMREDPVELMAADPLQRARWLAARTGCDATAIWEWGAVERVSTGLLATRIDLQPAGREMLAAAEAIAAAPTP